ncbi:hypothetical protein Bca4012_037722 [Brassica carinata]
MPPHPFNDDTAFAEITGPLNPIPLELFRYRNEEKLIALANTLFCMTLSEEAHGKSSFLATILIQRLVSFSHQKLCLLSCVLSLKK